MHSQKVTEVTERSALLKKDSTEEITNSHRLALQDEELGLVINGEDLIENKLIQPLSGKRKARIGAGYLSYTVPVLYAVLLFQTIYRLILDLEDDAISSNNQYSLYLFLQIFAILSVGACTASDIFTNLIATTPVPETAEKEHGEQVLVDDDVYLSMSELKKSFVNKSYYFTKTLSWGSYVVIGLSSLDGLSEYIDNIYANAGLAVVVVPLGFYFGHLLLTDKIKKHHYFLTSRLLDSKKEMLPYFKNKLPGSVEFIFELLSNIFHKSLTYGYVTSIALSTFKSNNRGVNIAFVTVGAFCGAYQTLFTRFIGAKKYILDNDVRNLQSHSSKCTSYGKRGGLLFFGLARTAGITYVIWRFSSTSPTNKIIAASVSALPFLIQNLGYVFKQPTNPDHNSQLSTGAKRISFTTNFLARSLRVAGIMAFTLNFSEFLKVNGVNISVGKLDALMISLSALGVESNNFHFYKLAMESGLTYWGKKKIIENNYSRRRNEKFSCARFFVRSIKEYPLIANNSIQAEQGESEIDDTKTLQGIEY